MALFCFTIYGFALAFTPLSSFSCPGNDESGEMMKEVKLVDGIPM